MAADSKASVCRTVMGDFDLERAKRFRQAYHLACDLHKQHKFDFEGTMFEVSFAKYLVEFFGVFFGKEFDPEEREEGHAIAYTKEQRASFVEAIDWVLEFVDWLLEQEPDLLDLYESTTQTKQQVEALKELRKLL